jgi:ATP-dependent DNA ligase
MDLFNVEPEKYWGFPASYSKEKKQLQLNTAIKSNNYLMAEKLDGHWHRFVVQDGKSKFQSRGISRVTGTYGDHTDHVPHIMKELNSIFTKDTMLIGEAYRVGENDANMTSIFGCNAPKALERQFTNPVLFYIFDVWFLDGYSLMDTSFLDRETYLKALQTRIKDLRYVQVANFLETDNFMNYLNNILEAGGEGVVLQSKNGKPEPKKRPARKTLKIKRELDESIDVIILNKIMANREYLGNYIEDWQYWENDKTNEKLNGSYFMNYSKGEPITAITKGYFHNWVTAVKVGLLDTNTNTIKPICKVSGLTDKLKEDLSLNFSKYKNTVMTISGMEVTNDRSIRHPKFIKFRSDLNIDDCTMEKTFGK